MSEGYQVTPTIDVSELLFCNEIFLKILFNAISTIYIMVPEVPIKKTVP